MVVEGQGEISNAPTVGIILPPPELRSTYCTNRFFHSLTHSPCLYQDKLKLPPAFFNETDIVEKTALFVARNGTVQLYDLE
jgi:hypothetical protein